jgi:hypothetical protein
MVYVRIRSRNLRHLWSVLPRIHASLWLTVLRHMYVPFPEPLASLAACLVPQPTSASLTTGPSCCVCVATMQSLPFAPCLH